MFPEYFAHFSLDKECADAGEEAEAALKYVREHGNKYREERIASGCDRLQLHTFTEAPAQILLKGHYALLRSYLWRMLTARRQQDCLKRLLGGELPKEDVVVSSTGRLPIGPAETSDMWQRACCDYGVILIFALLRTCTTTCSSFVSRGSRRSTASS